MEVLLPLHNNKTPHQQNSTPTHTQVDASHDPFLGDEDLFAKRETELKKRVNHRAAARARDADRWEENRLGASGVVRMREDVEEEGDEELRTHVVVHDIKPPFLDGRNVLSKQAR